ncbi:uncharacterized protein KQ657_003770 [Scheffersomyces spartinae]|uniref:Uncharacterized protein n=1 Tax=Scheffersomyces spartinae TaxID=45513 RepID=A0A9P7VC45_9ASCO|nr:uncharacterized protein KQ657_003770 [Scheffersomyces spartinae]KAG7195244.1 hypothetical protein KQ657_003770 [Scheffersomyces spartinae]
MDLFKFDEESFARSFTRGTELEDADELEDGQLEPNTQDKNGTHDEVEEEETAFEGGRKLDDFEPIKVLGQGAYGKVHLVQDKRSGKLFAQKQLRKPIIKLRDQAEKDLAHSKQVRRTISERQILTELTHHPNIVKLFYAFQDNNKFYLILEYIPGGELFHHLASPLNKLGNVFQEDHAAFYAAEMALGLRYLHTLGIVYRDLKPENCLLNNAGHLVLTDFGLSKSIGNNAEDERCSSVIGTPEYMAPEVLKGEEYDFAVDWWSLGCVIYDMMVGKPPFTGRSHKIITDKVLTSKLKLPFYFTKDAKDLLNKLLNKNPLKRFDVDGKWETFQGHRFFRKINWKSLEAQSEDTVPPIVPVITDPKLAENFDDEFTTMKISDYNDDQGINIPISAEGRMINDDSEPFIGFSYNASNSYIEKYY